MPTNIRLLQRAAANANLGTLTRDFTTYSNSAWIDGWPFVVAGGIIPTRDSSIVGTGDFTGLAYGPDATPGLYRIVIGAIRGGATYFDIQDTSGNVVDTGVVGAPYANLGLSFTLTQGTTAWAIGDGLTLTLTPAPLNIASIAFGVQLRDPLNGQASYGANVPLSLSYDPAGGGAQTLSNTGAAGVVYANVSDAGMAGLATADPFRAYAYDMLAVADGIRLTVYSGTIEHHPGKTFLPAS